MMIKVFDLLSNGDTTGIFQLESDGVRSVLKRLQPEHFEDIVAVTSLYRPGPMEEIPTYITRRHNPNQVAYLHPDLEPILKHIWCYHLSRTNNANSKSSCWF